MHSANDIRLLKCLDGVHYALEIVELNYRDLYDSCIGIQGPNSLDHLAAALSKSWTIIDAVNRIREISQSIPGLNKSDTKLVKFLRTTEVVEVYRNYTQHLRSELLKPNLDPFPVWGALSWVDPNDPKQSHMAVYGSITPGTGFAGMPYDRVEKKWASKVCLSLGNRSLSFDPLYSNVKEFGQYIVPWILGYYSPGVKLNNSVPILDVKAVDE